MSTATPASHRLAKIEAAIDQQDWSQALYQAGLAICERPEGQAPFAQLARLCFLLGDPSMGNAYLALANQSPKPNDRQAVTSWLNPGELDQMATLWRSQGAARLAPAGCGPAPLVATDFRLIAGGDVMLGRQMPGWVASRGIQTPFSKLAPLIQSADLAMANLETCVSTEGDFLDKGGRQPYYYHCLPEMLDVLISAGIHCVATGNNHAMDFGSEALAHQTQILESSGFLHFGAGCDAGEAAMPRYAQVKGITIAFIGVETETPRMAATATSAGVHYAAMSDVVRKLSGSIAIARAHADIVIVSPHWGINWEDTPTAKARECARLLIDLGADAILGHSAHILQGVEFHAGCPIVYDMGTLLFDRVVQSTMKDSALFDLTWNSQRACQLTVRPVRLRTARAQLAQGDEFDRICSLLTRLSTDLDPLVTIKASPVGLHFSGQPERNPVRDIEKLAPPKALQKADLPKVTEEIRSLRSNLVYCAMPQVDGVWPTPLVANRDLHILGARYTTPIRAGRGFICEVYFRAAAPNHTQRIEARIAAFTPQGEEVFAYIHPVAEGIHPPARWQMTDIICDRISVRPVKVAPDGVYNLCWSLLDLESGQTLPMDASDSRIFKGQVVIGELTISAHAPSSVVGIAAAPLLPRAEATEQPKYGGWHGRVAEFWAEEALVWVTQVLKKANLEPLSSKPEVVRDAPLVLIIRIDTASGAYFFKALEASNHFEPGLVDLLAERWSDRIAVPLATRPARGWMLTPDYGLPLRSTGNDVSRAKALQQAAAQLAEIQIASCQQVDVLLAMGVPDRRLHLLPDLFEKLLTDPRATHLDQADGLKQEELGQALALIPTLREVCQQLRHDACSASLDHGDLHLDNLLVKNGMIVLFDWDTAWVTHPFCSLLLAYHASGLQNAAALQSMAALNLAYLTPWSQKTGKTVAQLTPSLHQAIWIAHTKRALFWARDPQATDKNGSRRQTLVSKWIQLWLQRTALLVPAPPAPRPPKVGHCQPSPQPPKLATPENPLLLDLNSIARLTGGKWSGLSKDVFFTGFSFNRTYMASGSSGNLYLAAQHDRRHTFSNAEMKDMAQKAYAAGAVAVVIEDSVSGLSPDMPRLTIPSDVLALERLGLHVRDQLFTGKRVLVSGTEGKTGFKNMLHHVLSPQISTHAVTNSSNLGFSILASLASIRKNDRVAILEAAGTHPRRLAARSDDAKPHLFVLTEVGNEHINFHGSQQAVIESKADIVSGLVEGGFGLINADSRNYAATRQAILARKRVPLCLFGSDSHCNGRLLAREFKDNAWHVTANIEGHTVHYRLPLLGDHAPLASVSVLLAAYYLGADVAQAAAEFDTFKPFESQGALRRLAHKGGEITCYDNASRASLLSYQSTLGMAAKLTPPGPTGKKVAVIGQMIFLGDASEAGHAQLAPWIDAAGFDRIILVGKYTEVTFAHLQNSSAVIKRFPTYDRRNSGKLALQALIDATEAACNPGDLLFIKGEVDELGEHLRAKELPTDAPVPVYTAATPSPPLPAQTVDTSALAGLRPLQLSDLPLYRAAIDQTQRTTCQHFFALPFLLGQSAGQQFLVEEDAGSYCIYRLLGNGANKTLSVFLLPIPAQPAVIERCIQRVKAFNKTDRASLFRVDPEDAKLFKGRPNTRIVTCPQEYIYAPETYLNLSGNKNGNLRRAIGHIARRADLEVLDYQTSDAPECKQVLDLWASMQREKYGSVLYGSYTRNCLDMYDQFPRRDLFGKVIRLDGKICAFGFAGEIRHNMGNLFIAYSDLRIDGLNRFLWVQLLRSMAHLELVNGGNAGDTPGLAFAKQSLRPVFLFQPNQVYAG